MTTTVTVKARAWGAKVTKGDETFDLGAHEDGTYQLGETESLSVQHGEKPVDADEEGAQAPQGDKATAAPMGTDNRRSTEKSFPPVKETV